MSLTGLVTQTPLPAFLGALGVALLATAASGWLTLRWLRWRRLIADTPASMIRSASLGYVELSGRAQLMAGEPVIAPLSGRRCVWYRYALEERVEREWHPLESGSSDALFHLDDGTGRCVIDPVGARVIPSHSLRWQGPLRRPGFAPERVTLWERLFQPGRYRYTESLIPERTPLYVIGQLAALGSAQPPTVEEAVNARLVAWKRDQRALHRRFDRDGSGTINAAEWAQARATAEREVLLNWEAHQPTTEETPLMRQPRDGRPYLLSTISEARLIRRYLWRSLAAGITFLALGSMSAWVIGLRLAGL